MDGIELNSGRFARALPTFYLVPSDDTSDESSATFRRGEIRTMKVPPRPYKRGPQSNQSAFRRSF